MKSFKPFGPSLGKGKLSKKFIKCINDKIDKSTVNKKITVDWHVNAFH